MSRSRSDRAAILAIVALACAAPAAHAAAPVPVAVSQVAVAAAGTCALNVMIEGKRTCLASGKTCKPRYESKYRSRGFTCKRNANGRYRLVRRKLEF